MGYFFLLTPAFWINCFRAYNIARTVVLESWEVPNYVALLPLASRLQVVMASSLLEGCKISAKFRQVPPNS